MSRRSLRNQFKIDTVYKTFTFNDVTVYYGGLLKGIDRYGDKGYINDTRNFFIQQENGKLGEYVEIVGYNINIIWPGELWPLMEPELKKLPKKSYIPDPSLELYAIENGKKRRIN